MLDSSQYPWRACGSQGAENTAAEGIFFTFAQASVFCAKSPMNVSGHRAEGIATSISARESRTANFEANCADVIVFAPVIAFVVVTVAMEFDSPVLLNASKESSGLALFAVSRENATESAYFQS